MIANKLMGRQHHHYHYQRQQTTKIGKHTHIALDYTQKKHRCNSSFTSISTGDKAIVAYQLLRNCYSSSYLWIK